MKRLWLALLIAGCQPPPPPQARFVIDTDAPVPRLMDRLTLEVLGPDKQPLCASCKRELALDEDTGWPVPFGVDEPDDGAARYLRATLFPVGRTSAGVPQAATAVEQVTSVSFGNGDLAQRLFLSLTCAGQPGDLMIGYTCSGGARVAIEGAAPTDDGWATHLGSWMSDVQRTCSGEARSSTGVHDDEACIAGGTFWMGDLRRQGLGPAYDAVPEHAVAVSPFYLDRTEFTVGRFRKLLKTGFQSIGLYLARDPSDSYRSRCNLYLDVADDPVRDQLPLNCVTHDTGIDACAADGRRLPTEAEWEWAAGSREHEWLYPWGDETPACADLPGCDHKSAERRFGAPVGTYPRDQSVDGVFDLASNVIEWLDDDFAVYGTDCWTPGAYGRDPRCVAGRYETTSVRSGAFDDGAAFHDAIGSRRAELPGAWGPSLGFRCARDDGAP